MAVVILVVTLVIIPRKKKGKKEKSIPTPSEKKTEVIPSPATTVPSQVIYCPACGSKIFDGREFLY